MTKKIIFWVIVVIALIAAWYFLWYKPRQTAGLTEGADCKIIIANDGIIKNGVCVLKTPSSGGVGYFGK